MSVPKLRFPEFGDSGEWEEKKLGDLYSFKTTNSFSRDQLNYENGVARNIHYGDIHTKFSTLFNIKNENVPFVNPSESLEKIKPDCYCVESDIIFADASEDLEDIGKSIEIVHLNNQKLLSGLHTLLGRQKNNTFIVGFGGYLFKSNWIRNQIQKESQGTKVLGISATRLSSISIAFPVKKKEQQKIADCLSSIDDRITAETQKLDTLKAHKKGLMQKLFPTEGETLPKLRFPEFCDSGEWEEKNLGEIATLITEKTGNKKYTLMSINAGVGLVSQIEKFGREIAGNSYKNYFVIRENDFAYNKSATKDYPEGFIAMHSSVELAAVPNSIFTCFRIQDNKICPQYLKYLFLCNLHGKWLKQFISVGARAHGSLNIDNKDLLLLPIPLPKGESSLSEQQKIADCLSSIDEAIAAQSQAIDLLKLHKKGLMQQLFPSVEEVKG